MSSRFDIFPPGVLELRPNNMFVAGKDINFPAETNVDFVGAIHTVSTVHMLVPVLPQLAMKDVIAMENTGMKQADGNVRPYQPCELARAVDYVNKIATGERAEFISDWGFLTAALIGNYCLREEVTVPRIMFVDVHSKPQNRHLRDMVNNNLRNHLVDDQRSPQQTLLQLRSRAQHTHYRERTAAMQLAEDARLRGEGTGYGLIMGRGHQDIIRILNKDGVHTTVYDTAFKGMTLDWLYVMSHSIRLGNQLKQKDLPQDSEDWLRVRLYDGLELTAARMFGIRDDQAIKLAEVVSHISATELRTFRLQFEEYKKIEMRAAKATKWLQTRKINKVCGHLKSMLDRLDIEVGD